MVDEVTMDGRQCIGAWTKAKEHLASLRQQVNAAECRVSNTESDFIKWMCPADVKVGEKIAVWNLDILYQVEVTGTHPVRGNVTLRKRDGRF